MSKKNYAAYFNDDETATIARYSLERCGFAVKPNPWLKPAPKEGEKE